MNINIDNYYKEALLIRRVEETFLDLFVQLEMCTFAKKRSMNVLTRG